MRHLILALVFAGSLAACTDSTRDLKDVPEPLGNFRLGFSEVVAPNAKPVLVSQEVTPDEWIAAVDAAVEARFGRFDGDRVYHLGISVEEYSVAVRAPLVPSKSALGLRVTVWDDAVAAKLNDEAEAIVVIKVFEAKLTTTREEKITVLAQDAAAKIEDWMRQQMAEKGWFAGPVPTAAAPEATPAAPVSDVIVPPETLQAVRSATRPDGG